MSETRYRYNASGQCFEAEATCPNGCHWFAAGSWLELNEYGAWGDDRGYRCYCFASRAELTVDKETGAPLVTRMVSEATALAALCNGLVRCGTCDLYGDCAVKDGTCGECAAARLRAVQAQVERAETKGDGDHE